MTQSTTLIQESTLATGFQVLIFALLSTTAGCHGSCNVAWHRFSMHWPPECCCSHYSVLGGTCPCNHPATDPTDPTDPEVRNGNHCQCCSAHVPSLSVIVHTHAHVMSMWCVCAWSIWIRACPHGWMGECLAQSVGLFIAYGSEFTVTLEWDRDVQHPSGLRERPVW